MKKLLMILVLAISACASTPTGTFNDKVALAERTVQLVQVQATTLLRSKMITVAQDQLIQKQVQLSHDGLVLAKSLQATDPIQAAKQLVSIEAQLTALKEQTK